MSFKFFLLTAVVNVTAVIAGFAHLAFAIANPDKGHFHLAMAGLLFIAGLTGMSLIRSAFYRFLDNEWVDILGEARLQPQPDILGKWAIEGPDLHISFTFNEDGSFCITREDKHHPNKTKRFSGHYKLHGEEIAFEFDGDAFPIINQRTNSAIVVASDEERRITLAKSLRPKHALPLYHPDDMPRKPDVAFKA